MIDTPTTEIKNHPPRVAPSIPTIMLRPIPSCASVRMIRLATHPIKPPTVSQIIMSYVYCLVIGYDRKLRAISGRVCA
jgi:hypothetical protein